ncbi:MAG: hypothetical protein LBR53_11620 [Deltaproteobacteria bacterium]|jgi:hypothetical protein|nr:hypothetical protein [Deltaproteobacteria bacterium]
MRPRVNHRFRPRRSSAATALLAALFLVFAPACAPQYRYKPIPVKALEDYPGKASADGVTVGAEAFYDSARLAELFGFDLKKAGVVPVQIKIRNSGTKTVTVEPGSTLTDAKGLTWEVLPSSVVFQRIDEYTSGGLSMGQGAKRTLLWGLAGAVVGAAVGVATGTSVGEGAGKGAAVGGAMGASTAILGMGPEEDTSGDVVRDFSSRSIDHASIAPGEEASGFLYFPAESAAPENLRLNLAGDGPARTLQIAF